MSAATTTCLHSRMRARLQVISSLFKPVFKCGRVAFAGTFLLLLVLMIGPAQAKDFRWMQIPFEGTDYDIWLHPDTYTIGEGSPLYPQVLEDVAAIYAMDVESASLVDVNLAKHIVVLAQNSTYLDRQKLKSFLDFDALSHPWTKSHSFVDHSLNPFEFHYYSAATDAAAVIQLLWQDHGWPSILNLQHRIRLYAQVLFEALMQANPEFNMEIHYTDTGGLKRTATVPDMQSTLQAIHLLAIEQSEVEVASTIEKLLAAGTATSQSITITYEELRVVFEFITQNDAAAVTWGYKYTRVDITGKTDYIIDPDLQQLGNILTVLQAGFDLWAADAKYMLYTILAAGEGRKRLACLEDVLSDPQVAAYIDSVDPAIRQALEYVKQEFAKYTGTLLNRIINDLSEALPQVLQRFLEGKLISTLIAEFGGPVGILAYIDLEAWKLVFETHETFQNMSAGATLSRALEKCVEIEPNSWYIRTLSRLDTEPQEVVERLCSYGTIRAALGWSFFKRAHEYYYPEGILADLLRTLQIYPHYNQEHLALLIQARQRNRNAVYGLRPPFYLSWKWDLTGELPDDESNRPYAALWDKVEYSMPTASIDSIVPNPAKQGAHTLTFTASPCDPILPIHLYRWTSDLGKTDGGAELYCGPNLSFSLPASDLKAGIHGISLAAQDHNGYWSETVTTSLTIQPRVPEEGHDLAITQFDLSPHDVVETDGEVLVNVTVTNEGDYEEFRFSVHYFLRDTNGQILDDHDESASNVLPPKISRDMPSIVLQSPGGYEGIATVEARINVALDQDPSNSVESASLYIGEVPPQDGYFGGSWTMLWGHTISAVEGCYRVEDLLMSQVEWSATVVNTCSDHRFPVSGAIGEMLIADGGNVAVSYFGFYDPLPVGPTNPPRYGIVILAPDSSNAWADEKHCIVREGQTAEWIIHRTPSSTSCQNYYVVLSGDGSTVGSWAFSDERIDPYTRRIRATPPKGSARNYEFWLMNCWTFEINAPEPRRYDDALAIRLELTALPDDPPDTYINTGPEGTITYSDVPFTWTGVDDWTPLENLEYAFRLYPIEQYFSEWSNVREKTYLDVPNKTYRFEVKARDDARQSNETPATRSFTVDINHTPLTPRNEYPAHGLSDVSATTALVASVFSDADGNDTHAGSRFQVKEDGSTYANCTYDREFSGAVTSVQIPATEPLRHSTKYWWRCKYQDDTGVWSEWSNETSFTTKADRSLRTDLTEDSFVDFKDYAMFVNRWYEICYSPNWCDNSDFDCSGAVDFRDAAILATNWLQSAKTISHGTVVVDGDLAEWSDAEWIPLDSVYYGSCQDVNEAVFAVHWNRDTNKIYLAVVVQDCEYTFAADYNNCDDWNASDRIEIFAQGDAIGGSGWNGRDELGLYDSAQQYMVGPNTAGGSWARWGCGQSIEPEARLEYAVKTFDGLIVYEVGLRIFDNYGVRSGEDTIVSDLADGRTVSFDLLAATRYSEGFGVLAETGSSPQCNKSANADCFAKYLLVE